jgi:hypothetical protein
MMTIEATLGDAGFQIELDPGCPTALAHWLCKRSPLSTRVHPSSVVGNMFYLLSDCVLPDCEPDVDVNVVEPGTWVYWPNRQFIEFIYGTLEKEDTSVVIVGTTTAGLAELVTEAEKNASDRQSILTLRWAGAAPAFQEKKYPPLAYEENRVVQLVRSAAEDWWGSEPDFITGLASKDDVVKARGGLALVESIASRHQELMWQVIKKRDELERQSMADVLDVTASSFLSQLREPLSLTGASMDKIADAQAHFEHCTAAGLEQIAIDMARAFAAVARWSSLRAR